MCWPVDASVYGCTAFSAEHQVAAVHRLTQETCKVGEPSCGGRRRMGGALEPDPAVLMGTAADGPATRCPSTIDSAPAINCATELPLPLITVRRRCSFCSLDVVVQTRCPVTKCNAICSKWYM